VNGGIWLKIISIHSGFTLIEVIIVVGLLLLIANIVFSGFNFFDNYELRVQARRLCNDIRYIRQLSMTQGGEYVISLNKNYYIIKNGMDQIKKVDFGKKFELFWTGTFEIKFNYNGCPGDTAQTLTLKSKKTKNKMDITIVVASGRVLLYDSIY
jgi:prepilin-type N-terminal cleavage/methylation domain-containing protein